MTTTRTALEPEDVYRLSSHVSKLYRGYGSTHKVSQAMFAESVLITTAWPPGRRNPGHNPERAPVEKLQDSQ